ncbi:MAG: tRNA preQ1(34) S-adenosylmethionine ribosyltransferase-isomerase QueA [Ruminococcaceae bacterium]|nr:tRNA preQ1(34) S-adenosylmethionine ribosyltransferase-isomerase QueA [Oscillospiraceae bacterium]
MNVKDFDYYLPEELIAQTPLENRPASRLLVLDKNTGKTQHGSFSDILSFLKEGDCLVLNDTKVLPARLYGNREDSGAPVEFLLLTQKENDIWEIIVKPGKKCRIGHRIVFGNGKLRAEIIDIVNEGNRLVRFEYDGIFNEILSELGEMPLPPYITKKLDNPDRYQTVYAREEGSAAAPTAGLHFDNDLLDKIRAMGVSLAFVTLHVGLGTFRPVKVDVIEEHKMHSEFYTVSKATASIINETKKRGGRVICVGTTSCRTVESAADDDGLLTEKSGWTDIFIYPGYKFKVLDALITNFHLPQSTLIMLVSSLAGRENVLNAYMEAVKEKYRFFSFGDAMFIQ